MARAAAPKPLTYGRLLSEVQQDHTVRKPLYQKLEAHLGGNVVVVAFFASFAWPGILQDTDADMLEEALQNVDLDGKDLVLMINSPGGEALPAERIVNICRSFGGGAFSAIVPKMAKSAATMVCLGAKKIAMSRTSELGPIDPQIPVEADNGGVKYLAAHEIIESYKDLMDKANRTKGRIEPFLQQLARFDARDIRRIVSAQQLSESIAVTSLKTGVFAGMTAKQIKQKIKPFLDPRSTVSHGRPIYADAAQKCGLPIEVHDVKGPLWQTVWELYIRLNHLVTSPQLPIAKVIESSDDSYTAPIDLSLVS